MYSKCIVVDLEVLCMDSDFMNNFASAMKNGNIPNNIKNLMNNSNINNNSNHNTNNNAHSFNDTDTVNTDTTSSNNINPEMFKNIMSMFSNYNNSGNSSNFDGSNKDNSSNDFSNSNGSMPNIDINMLLKMKSIMDKMNSNKNDPRSNLLLSLKPYLKQSRKSKVEQYVQLFNMTKVIDAFNQNGGENSK